MLFDNQEKVKAVSFWWINYRIPKCSIYLQIELHFLQKNIND